LRTADDTGEFKHVEGILKASGGGFGSVAFAPKSSYEPKAKVNLASLRVVFEAAKTQVFSSGLVYDGPSSVTVRLVMLVARNKSLSGSFVGKWNIASILQDKGIIVHAKKANSIFFFELSQ